MIKNWEQFNESLHVDDSTVEEMEKAYVDLKEKALKLKEKIFSKKKKEKTEKVGKV